MRSLGHPVADKAARQRYLGSSIWFTVPGTYLVLWATYAILPPLQGQEEAGAEVPVSVDNLAKVIEPA